MTQTRRQYLEKWRSELMTLGDRELGVYILHYTGHFQYPRGKMPPLDLSDLTLHDRLWPTFSKEQLETPIGRAPRSTALLKLVERTSPSHPSKQARERYESAVLAVGQQARALLQNDPAAWWNVLQRRQEALLATWQSTNDRAVGMEKQARELRAHADSIQTELDTVRVQLAELESR